MPSVIIKYENAKPRVNISHQSHGLYKDHQSYVIILRT